MMSASPSLCSYRPSSPCAECISEHVTQFARDTTTSTSWIDESVLPPPFVPTPEVEVADDRRLFTDDAEAVARATAVSDVTPDERGLTNISPVRRIPTSNAVARVLNVVPTTTLDMPSCIDNTLDRNIIPKSHATANLFSKSSPPQQSSPCGAASTHLDPGQCAQSSTVLVISAPHSDLPRRYSIWRADNALPALEMHRDELAEGEPGERRQGPTRAKPRPQGLLS
jgi:hypothetical protein